MNLSNLKPFYGSRKKNNFRKGRGHGSGNGKTAGKGHKGQKARSGSKRFGFEGGQMPLYKRIPKKGFNNRYKKNKNVIVNVAILNKFKDGSKISPIILSLYKIIPNIYNNIKVLGNEKITKKIYLKTNFISKNAKNRVEAAGGIVKII